MAEILLIIKAMKEAATIAGALLGIASSYLASVIPMPYIPENFEKRAAARFKDAAKRWSKIDETRKNLYFWVEDFESFKEYCGMNHIEKEWVVRELLDLWIDELHKDKVCRQIVIEMRLDEVKTQIALSLEEIKKGQAQLKEISDFLHRFESKGTSSFPENKNYITRYCERVGTNIEFQILLGNYEYKTLASFVLAENENEGLAGRYVLYSNMQTGKTTELRHLGEVLSKSGMYLPLLICAGMVKGLKYDDFPREHTVGGKPVVLLIDAVDETEENGFCSLLHDIENFANNHPEIRMVISCRCNFCSIAKPRGFTELELLPLRWDDTLAYIRMRVADNAGALEQAIVDKQLVELARIPLTLNAIIDCFLEGGKIPDKRSDLYERILTNSLNAEKEKQLKDYPISTSKERKTLEVAAAAMLMMGGREMPDDDFEELLRQKGYGLKYDHIRFDVIQRTERNGVIYVGFNSNAIMDYMAAGFLLRYKTLEEILPLIYIEGTHELHPLWHSPLMLWMEMIADDEQQIKSEAISWLWNDQKELAVIAPDNLIEEKQKSEITIDLLNKYRSENRGFYLLGNDHNPPVRKFSDALIQYLKEEWERTTVFGKHFYNILRVTRMIDWRWLYQTNKPLAQDFEELLYRLIDRPLYVLKALDSVFMAMTNEYFFCEEQIRKLFAYVHNRVDDSIIEMMTSRLATLDHPDEFVDYIGKANQVLVTDIRKNRTIYQRTPIYQIIAKLLQKDAIMKALEIMKGNIYWQYADDRAEADEIYHRSVERLKAIADEPDLDELEAIIPEIEKQRDIWIIRPISQPSDEQKQQYIESSRHELALLNNLDEFRKVGLKVVNNENDRSAFMELDLQHIYEHPSEIDESWTSPNQYVMEYLMQHAGSSGSGIWRINRVISKKCFDNGDLMRRYQMQVFYRFMSGVRRDIQLTDDQVSQCLATAQEVLNELVEQRIFFGHFTHSARIALTLFVQKKIDVNHTAENCRSLLRYICIPLEKVIDNIDDDCESSGLLPYLKTFVSTEEEYLNIITDLFATAKDGEVDPNAYEKWIEYLLAFHYQPAIELLTEKVLTGKIGSRRKWIKALIKEGRKTEVLKKRVEDSTNILKGEEVGGADTELLMEVCESLKGDKSQKGWAKSQLEVYMEKADAFSLHRCLEMLFKLGSEKALVFIEENEHILRNDRHYEFTYSDSSSINLLVKAYNCCLNRKVFKLSLHSLLESLETIAMIDEECKNRVKEEMVGNIVRLGGPDDMTPTQWASQLDLKFASTHQVGKTLQEILKII